MIIPSQEHVLYVFMYFRHFSSICMLTYIYLLYTCVYVVRFLLEERKRAICITENDQFISYYAWNYQGSYSYQHDYIMKSLKSVHRSQI